MSSCYYLTCQPEKLLQLFIPLTKFCTTFHYIVSDFNRCSPSVLACCSILNLN